LSAFESSQVQYVDSDFPWGPDSLGAVGGDSARAQGSLADIKWKRISDIYPDSKHVMFAEGTTPYSNMRQGALGDCYYLATLVSLDSRPGALEELFVT